MERLILSKLLDWKNSPYRKPLILKGVRQVGKTWAFEKFGKRCYENTEHFNFDENEEYKQFFETTKDVDRLLQNPMLASGKKLFPKISMIWKSIPSQLARENKKFIYKVIKEGARAREYEDALQWLVDARLVHKVYRRSAPGCPLRPMMTCLPLRFIWWMWGSSAVWHSWLPRLLERATVCSPSSKAL
jgi:hypothetical protein